MNESTLENRIIDLESKLAFQEDTIQELNAIVTEQQKELAQVNQALQRMQMQMTQMMASNIATNSEETPPPHY